jgi:hypothetical protein
MASNTMEPRAGDGQKPTENARPLKRVVQLWPVVLMPVTGRAISRADDDDAGVAGIGRVGSWSSE